MWLFFFFKQKTAYEMRISDGSSNVCSSDLGAELQVSIAPSRHLNVGINASLLDGKFTSNPQFAGATLAYKGNRLSRAPRYKISNYIELNEDLFGGTATVRLSQAFQRSYFYNPDRKSTRLNSSH